MELTIITMLIKKTAKYNVKEKQTANGKYMILILMI
jgi:hypothetical protein